MFKQQYLNRLFILNLLRTSSQTETLIWECDNCRKERNLTVNSKEVSTKEILDRSRGSSDSRLSCFTWNSKISTG